MRLLSFLVEQLPWVKPVLAWAFALALLLIIWAITTVPAYLLVTYVRKVRQQIDSFSKRIAEKYFPLYWECQQRVLLQFEPFYRSHSFQHLFDKNLVLWRLMTERATTNVAELVGLLRDVDAHTRSSVQRVSSVADEVQRLDFTASKIPNLPSVSNMVDDLRSIRREKANLIIAGLIVAAIIVVNTGMLSQILKDVLEIGSIKVYAGLRLYHFLAALLTLIEAGVGVYHGYKRLQGAGPTEQFSVAIAVALAGAVGLASIEGFFYSRLGSPQEVFTIPGIGLTFTMQQAFFLWGFILPLMLFGLGDMCYRAVMRIRDGYAVKQLRTELKKSSELSDRLHKGVAKVTAALAKATEECRRAQELTPGYSEVRANETIGRVESIKQDLIALGKSTPEWAAKLLEPLTSAEVHQQALRIGAWLLLTSLASFILVAVELRLTQVAHPGLGTGLALVIGIAECAVPLAAGMLLRTSPRIVDGSTVSLRPVEGSRMLFSHIFAAVLVAALLAFEVTELSQASVSSGRMLARGAIIGLALTLVAFGRELPGMISLTFCAFSGVVVIVEAVLALVCVWSLRLLVLLFFLLEFFLGIVALPAEWFLRLKAAPAIAT